MQSNDTVFNHRNHFLGFASHKTGQTKTTPENLQANAFAATARSNSNTPDDTMFFGAWLGT